MVVQLWYGVLVGWCGWGSRRDRLEICLEQEGMPEGDIRLGAGGGAAALPTYEEGVPAPTPTEGGVVVRCGWTVVCCVGCAVLL